MSVQALKDEKVLFFSLSKKNPSTETIPSIDEIIFQDEDGKLKKRVIRYLIGDPTIYPDTTVDELKKNPGSRIVFKNGVLPVSSFELNQLEYLRKSNYNLSNPLRDKTKPALFRENIKGEDAIKYVDTSVAKVEAQYRIHKMSGMEIELLAYAVGSFSNVSKTLTVDLKRDLLILSEKNYQLINKLVDNFDETKKRALINKAFEVGKLIINGDSVAWDTGQGILNVGYGKNFKEEMYLFVSSPNGKQVYESLYTQLNPTEKIAQQNFVQPQPAKPQPETVTTTTPTQKEQFFVNSRDEEMINIFNKALQLGVLISEGNNIYLIDKPKNILLGTSTRDVISRMTDDAMLLSKIDRKIEKVEK